MYLEGSLGMSVLDQVTSGWRGSNEGGALKTMTLWTSPNSSASNISGFSALPAGNRNSVGTYSNLNTFTSWWTTTSSVSANAWTRLIGYNNANVLRSDYSKPYGLSVRCVRD
jgi:uncharacterized protein (TIGR02145 family)